MAGGDFPLQRLWVVLPCCSSKTTICTNRVGLNKSSCEWGCCLCAAQREDLPLAKLRSALACWVFREKEENASWTWWHLNSVWFFCLFVLVDVSPLIQRGETLMRGMLLVFECNWCVHDQRNPLYKCRLRAHVIEKNLSSPKELLGRRLLLSWVWLSIYLQHTFHTKLLKLMDR